MYPFQTKYVLFFSAIFIFSRPVCVRLLFIMWCRALESSKYSEKGFQYVIFLTHILIFRHYSFKRIGPNFLSRNFRCHANWNRIQRALILHCSSDISKIVWWLQFLFFILVVSVIYLNSWGYIGWGPVWVFETFRVLSLSLSLSLSLPLSLSLSLSLSLLFSFSFSFFCLSLGGPFSSGPPGHCPPMPPSRYTTGCDCYVDPAPNLWFIVNVLT